MEGNDFESKLRKRLKDGAVCHWATVPVRIPVTTRFLGFSAALLCYKASHMYKPPPEEMCNVYAVYRVHLALFEQAMMRKSHYRGEDGYDFSAFPDRFLLMPGTPSILGTFFGQLGYFVFGGVRYEPYFAANRFDDGGRFVPQSEHVTLSNLRMTVEALGDPQTPLPVREAFYRCNPIPGCVWRVSDKLLLNGDEIMPEGYHLGKDVALYHRMCDLMWYRKERRLFSRQGLSLEPVGRPGLLVANRQGNLRIVDRDEGETLQDYHRKVYVDGDVDNFWSPHKLDDLHSLEGMLCLAGELPNLDSHVYPGYALRAEKCSGWRSFEDWQIITSRLKW